MYDKNKASIQDDKTMENDEIKRYTDILRMNKNIILQGAPGTGKTYNTAALALSLILAGIAMQCAPLNDNRKITKMATYYRKNKIGDWRHGRHIAHD